MKNIVTALLLTLWIQSSWSKPKYDSDKTVSVVNDMLTAHGGMARWNEINHMQFDLAMYLSSLPLDQGRNASDNWRNISVDLDTKTSVTSVNIPFEDNDVAEVVFDGNQLWANAYSFDQSRFRDTPVMLLWFHSSMLRLPFLTQVDGVELSYVKQDVLKGSDQLYDVIKMSFNPEGKNHPHNLELYIDTESHLLKAWVQNVVVPLLPGNILPQEFDMAAGGQLRVVEQYAKVGGITLPRAYSTYDPKRGGLLLGAHMVTGVTFSNKPFYISEPKPETAPLLYTVK